MKRIDANFIASLDQNKAALTDLMIEQPLLSVLLCEHLVHGPLGTPENLRTASPYILWIVVDLMCLALGEIELARMSSEDEGEPN